MPVQSRGRSDNGEALFIDGAPLLSPFLPLLRDLPHRRTKDDRPPKNAEARPATPGAKRSPHVECER